ncbi:DUF1684 domain-containing protein [Reichenbachiella ulvae]|uniref:DUF1684 domain-containing protein n=1 Tax=Reichenbachiella ulvae TaxID=2980104 RepID=A0ABT3CYN2_9BACT|nr:DUF1684 domain-containing protein [Reichenbachiella ulvae]MCV9388694.1 DUF1684 domain-containing protein [Reichenbachiella ulvae]
MKKIIPAIAIIALLVFIFIPEKDSESTEAYNEEIQKERTEKDNYLSTSSNSPFYIYGDTTVQLKYFPINQEYKVIAKVSLIEEKRLITLPNSDGSSTEYRKYAIASFTLGGQDHQLLILKNTEEGTLFTAFADQTSANETYGGGRYLDLDFTRATRITIDFNRAYNPYCNYNHDYSCPLPPKENLLDIEIRAGEKNYI